MNISYNSTVPLQVPCVTKLSKRYKNCYCYIAYDLKTEKKNPKHNKSNYISSSVYKKKYYKALKMSGLCQNATCINLRDDIEKKACRMKNSV